MVLKLPKFEQLQLTHIPNSRQTPDGRLIGIGINPYEHFVKV